MEYELAKQLKDAGFPQKVSVNTMIWKNGDWTVALGEEIELATVLVRPTLSELIEECGTRVRLDWFPATKSAYANCCDKSQHQHLGSTPEEAVAHLWLALNNK